MLITFEGGEGAGKTTLINRIEEELLRHGLELVKTREPGGTKLSDHIRSWLLDRDFEIQVGSQAELLLFLAARVQHLEELIIPALKAKKVVLCDRFNDSSVVYQGLARGLGIEKIKNLCSLVCNGLEPDLTFFLDVDPAVGLERTKRTRKENAKTGEVDRIESEGLDFHRLVQKGFQDLALKDNKRIHTLDANKSEDEVFAQAMITLKDYLNTKT